VDQVKKFPGKIVPPQIPFNHLKHYRNRGMPVRRGRKPPRARALLKNPGSDGKNPQNHCTPPFGCPPGPARGTGMADPRHFPEKTGSFFPDQEPPLFSDHNAHPGTPEVPHDQFVLPPFHGQRNAAKLAGFFLFKMTGFKK
jgi:hypothetical protein